MKYFSLLVYLLVFGIQILFPIQVAAQEPEISSQLVKVSKKRISRTVFDFTLKATLINYDQSIKNISATISSSSPYTTIMDDGTVHFNAVGTNEIATSTDTFVLRQDRRQEFDPEAIHWVINYDPVVELHEIEMDAAIDMRQSARLQLGDRERMFAGYHFFSKHKELFTVRIEHKIEPEQGLELTPLPNNILPSSTTGKVSEYVPQYLTATQAGNYVITTTGTIIESGETFTARTEVLVTEGELPPDMGLLSSWPNVLAADAVTDVMFSLRFNGYDLNKIIAVKLKNLQTGDSIIIHDGVYKHGQHNGKYSATLALDTSGMKSDDCFRYQVTAETTHGSFNSNVYKLCVTRFPVRFNRTVERSIITDPETGVQASADEILIIVKKGTPESAIATIAASVNGYVTDTIPELQSYQIQLDTAVTSMQQLNNIIATLSAHPEVEHAAPNIALKLNSLQTDDNLLSAQHHLVSVRARESWFVTQGGILDVIAIVDSGIDVNHPDLERKIIGGDNFSGLFGTFSSDYSDHKGHGSHVAGIAAAETNNAIGVAGVSWNNSLLIAKVTHDFDFLPGDAFLGAIRRGIKYSADQNADIINISMGLSGEGIGGAVFKLFVCPAVSHAINRSSIVVAGAGNDNVSEPYYPAACPGVLSVGGTSGLIEPKKYSDSNFGPWVKIAAPAIAVLSTVPANDSCSVDDLCDASGYEKSTGTSMSTPIVSGALALVKARSPTLSNEELKEKIINSAIKLPDSGFSGGHLDVFEAVFNGSFELVDEKIINKPEEWEQANDFSRTCKSLDTLYSLLPVPDEDYPERNQRMLVCDNGGVVAGGSKNSIDIPEGVTELPISFDWRIVAEDLIENGLPGAIIQDCYFKFIAVNVPPQYVCEPRFMQRDDFSANAALSLEGSTLFMLDHLRFRES